MDTVAAKERLIRSMKLHVYVSPKVEAAFRAVPRERFVPPEYDGDAYADTAIFLADGSTVSQPSMIAQVLDCLNLFDGCSVLEIGSGSGYLMALIHEMGAEVTGVEVIPQLVDRSRKVLEDLGVECEIHCMSGERAAGLGKFDRIVFSAAVERIPDWSKEMLNEGGTVVAPVGNRYKQEMQIQSKERTVQTGKLCRFVPYT